MRLPGRLVRGPLRPDRGSLARFVSLRWAALPIVDRRWTAPLSAVALGFGLFVGVAIGPGAEGSFGTSGPTIVRVPMPDGTQTAKAPPPSDGGGPDEPAPAPSGGDGGDGGPTAGFPDAPPPVFDTPSPSPPITTAPPLTSPPVTQPPADTDGGDQDADDAGSAADTETTLTGTVVHINPNAASYAIATEEGALKAIHSHKPPALGRDVEVEAKPLANGTYNESGKRTETGKRGRVSLDGTVSYRDSVTGAYTVSGPGVSLLVRGGAQRTPPRVGERVEVTARIADHPEELPVSAPGEQGCGEPPKPPKPPPEALEQAGLTVLDGDPATTVDVEAIVEGVCRDARKLVVSADDLRESGRDIAVAVPKALKVSGLKPGQTLKLSVEIGDAGALTLSTVAGDEGKRGAEHPDLVQPSADDDAERKR